MGLFGNRNLRRFVPDFTKPEDENWLVFVGSGGTSLEWASLKKKYNWKFPESEEEKFMRYQKEVKKVADAYYSRMQIIEGNWSVLYNLGSYDTPLAEKFEKDCITNIADYKEMQRIDKKYGQKTATNIPAFRRLAMLYEKQGRFEDAVDVCKQAYALGMDERSRMARMIKKAGRKLTLEEEKLFEK